MNKSLIYWISAAYKHNTPEITKLLAEDASPASTLRFVIRRLARRWIRNFDLAAQDIARSLAMGASGFSDSALRRSLARHDVTVSFRASPAVRDILQATIAENVALIKSIPRQHLAQVEVLVMNSVKEGRDLKTLVAELQNQFRTTRNRAELIARDQNNKTTAAITRARQAEIGITEAYWVHSGAGMHPRPSHVKASRDKVKYNIAEGWLDPAINKRIWPGTEINCRCVSRAVLPI